MYGQYQKLLEWINEINEFSKDAVYKINIQKSVACLYTNELSEIEVKKTVASERKNLAMNLTKEVKDLCSENCRTLRKEIEDNANKWKDTLFRDQ